MGHAFSSLDRSTLDASTATIVATDRELNIGYVNPTWFRFAAENGGEPAISLRFGVGTNLLDPLPEPLIGFYRSLFGRALHEFPPEGMHPLTHEYECSSPDTFRRFAMSIYSLRGQQGLLISHTLRVEAPVERSPGFIEGTVGADYVATDGMVRQCACCRRIRSAREPQQWHWIREWVRHSPKNITHTVCSVCATQYYPGLY
jgi:hypothetical protein